MMLIIVSLLFVGFLSGWLGFLLFGDMARYTKVLFISKEAVIRAEEARIREETEGSNEDHKEHMFFGDRHALQHIKSIAGTFENRRTKVVFISEESGAVMNGSAISDIVHKELIRVLQQKREKKEK